jgi:His-Xaa-Ser system protein HxsD
MESEHESRVSGRDGLFVHASQDTLLVEVDESLYTIDALFRTCYMFTDRAFLYLRRATPSVVEVHISPKGEVGDGLFALAGEFCNELVDYRVRSLVSAETGKIRELIVAQAFAEGNLIDELGGTNEQGDDYSRDPHNIGNYHE